MRFYAITDKGLERAINEDYYALRDDMAGISLVMIIADGMGGHAGGEVASKLAVESAIDYILRRLINISKTQRQSNNNPRILIRNAVKYANKKIIDMADKNPELKGMGTTLVVALLIDGVLHIGNVGDSRLYLYEKDSLKQITVDHSWVEEQVSRGLLTKLEAEYSLYKNVITHVVGNEEILKVDYYNRILEDDNLIMICTDGLTNMLTDSQLVEILQKSDNPEAACREMVRQANLKGGEDNITVLIAENKD